MGRRRYGRDSFQGTPHHSFPALQSTKLSQVFFFFSFWRRDKNPDRNCRGGRGYPAFEAWHSIWACPKPCPLPNTGPECQAFPLPLCGVFVQKCRR